MASQLFDLSYIVVGAETNHKPDAEINTRDRFIGDRRIEILFAIDEYLKLLSQFLLLPSSLPQLVAYLSFWGFHLARHVQFPNPNTKRIRLLHHRRLRRRRPHRRLRLHLSPNPERYRKSDQRPGVRAQLSSCLVSEGLQIANTGGAND